MKLSVDLTVIERYNGYVTVINDLLNTIPQVVYGNDVRYILKSISPSISVRYTDNLNLVQKSMTSQSESPCLVAIHHEYSKSDIKICFVLHM